MSDHAGFLAAVLAEPDSDNPRLVYADWLEEQGDPRGEFIRVQCELARAPRNTHGNCSYCGVMSDAHREGCRAGALRRREGELMGHDDFPSWCPPVIVNNCIESRYRRGFIDFVRLSGDAWITHRAAILAVAPVREVRLTTCRAEDVDRLLVMFGGMPGNWEGISEPPGIYSVARVLLRALWPGITFTLPRDPRLFRGAPGDLAVTVGTPSQYAGVLEHGTRRPKPEPRIRPERI